MNPLSNFERMIWASAWQHHRKYQIPLDDLAQEGYAIAAQCVQEFDPSKASFSTFLYFNLNSRLPKYCKKWKREMNHSMEEMPEQAYKDPIEFDLIMQDEKKNLSEQAQGIIHALLNCPDTFHAYNPHINDDTKWSRSIKKDHVKKYLQDAKGLRRNQAAKVIQELTTFCSKMKGKP